MPITSVLWEYSTYCFGVQMAIHEGRKTLCWIPTSPFILFLFRIQHATVQTAKLQSTQYQGCICREGQGVYPLHNVADPPKCFRASIIITIFGTKTVSHYILFMVQTLNPPC